MVDFAHAETFDDIPIIDLTPLIQGGNEDLVARQIHYAATQVGFFYLSGHGIPQDLIDCAFDATQTFFALPPAEKASIAVNQQQRGWLAPGMSRLAGSKTHDLKEVFFWGPDIQPDDPDMLAGKPLVAANQWPDAVCPTLRRDLIPYYDAVCAIARRVLSALAVSLDCPANAFAAAYEKPLARGQLVYYPPSGTRDEADERFGVAPHTDFGVLTFLLQDDSGGLQIQRKDGAWIAAPPIPGTLVCNIGDLLQRWSNDRFRSTCHRVINRSGHARYSIPIFFDPHTDARIDPCDLGTPRHQSHYEPILAGAHIMSRNRQSFAQFKKDE